MRVLGGKTHDGDYMIIVNPGEKKLLLAVYAYVQSEGIDNIEQALQTKYLEDELRKQIRYRDSQLVAARQQIEKYKNERDQWQQKQLDTAEKLAMTRKEIAKTRKERTRWKRLQAETANELSSTLELLDNKQTHENLRTKVLRLFKNG